MRFVVDMTEWGNVVDVAATEYCVGTTKDPDVGVAVISWFRNWWESLENVGSCQHAYL